mmetsp:Transcript_21374/g.46762  ORF Transcript_21374/g.46762 Transcript_21374/m.46762 type:complete len:138 (+) Transcript_21374:1402-1815(+)
MQFLMPGRILTSSCPHQAGRTCAIGGYTLSWGAHLAGEAGAQDERANVCSGEALRLLHAMLDAWQDIDRAIRPDLCHSWLYSGLGGSPGGRANVCSGEAVRTRYLNLGSCSAAYMGHAAPPSYFMCSVMAVSIIYSP